MILPIIVYGHPALRKVASEVPKDYPNLQTLIDNMFETMKKAKGVGLAAPQVDLSLRLFVIDADGFKEDHPEAAGFKEVFINPEILEHSKEEDTFNEGCLSLPDIHEDVVRPVSVTIQYTNSEGENLTRTYSGVIARIIQHEMDHIEGNVFTDRLGNLRKMLLKRKLAEVASGKIKPDYKTKLFKK